MGPPDSGNVPPKPEGAAYAWIRDKVWVDLNNLSLMPGFGELMDNVVTNWDLWKEYTLIDSPQDVPLPGGMSDKLTAFEVMCLISILGFWMTLVDFIIQAMLVLRVFREEKLVFAVRNFVQISLGKEFTESPPFDLEGAYNDSTNESPLIFILSPGADPNDYLLALAKNKVVSSSKCFLLCILLNRSSP